MFILRHNSCLLDKTRTYQDEEEAGAVAQRQCRLSVGRLRVEEASNAMSVSWPNYLENKQKYIKILS